MPDKKDKTNEGDRHTMPDSPVAKKESQPSMPAVKAEAVDKARQKAEEALRAEKENKAHTLKSHVMALLLLQRWCRQVGMVDSKGKNIEEDIKTALLRTGELIQVDDSEELSEDIQKRLEAAATLMSPEMAGEVKLILDPVEAKIEQMRAKIGDLESNPNYLMSFKLGGSLRDDITEALDLMRPGAEIHGRVLANNPWVLQQGAAPHFRGHDELQLKRMEIDKRMSDLLSRPVSVTEFEARYELTEELIKEIMDSAEKASEPFEIAQKMPALMSSQLNLLYNCISGQACNLFENQEYELGDTEAESLSTAIETLNECLLALIEIRKTKKTIPTLS